MDAALASMYASVPETRQLANRAKAVQPRRRRSWNWVIRRIVQGSPEPSISCSDSNFAR